MSLSLPATSAEFLSADPAEVAAIILDEYAEQGELRIDTAAFQVVQQLDGEHGLSAGRRRQAGLVVSEACNLLERVGALCQQPESDDPRDLLVTMRGHQFRAAEDPAAELRRAAA